MLAARIGEVIGGFAFLYAIAFCILFANKKRKQNPSPYLAAGVVCGILAIATSAQKPESTAPIACYLLWLSLVFRYESEASIPPSGLSRIRWIAHGLMLVGCFLPLDQEYGLNNAIAFAYFGWAMIVIGVLWSWVRMVPMLRK